VTHPSIFETILRPQRRSRKKTGDSPWITSYADLTTNLMALFVLMLAMSQVNVQKFDAVSQVVTRQRTDSLDELKKQIDAQIATRGLSGSVSTELGMSGLMVEFLGSVLFEQGSDKLSAFAAREAVPILQILQNTDSKYLLSFEGHTDDVGKDDLNWALSSARGVSLLNRMRALNVSQERMSVAGFGSTRPKVSTEGKSGEELEKARSLNRRVVIRVYQ